jgi:hypothetical protein
MIIKRLINSFALERGIRLTVIADNRDEAWKELTSWLVEVTQCNAFESKFNVQGTLMGGVVDIEKLERDGWTWNGAEKDNEKV